jgi:hypothetical protein
MKNFCLEVPGTLQGKLARCYHGGMLAIRFGAFHFQMHERVLGGSACSARSRLSRTVAIGRNCRLWKCVDVECNHIVAAVTMMCCTPLKCRSACNSQTGHMMLLELNSLILSGKRSVVQREHRELGIGSAFRRNSCTIAANRQE